MEKRGSPSMRKAIGQWLLETMRSRDWSAERWGREAGIAPTTITRFLNDTDFEHTLSMTTLEKLSRAADIPINFRALQIEQVYVAVIGRRELLDRYKMPDKTDFDIYHLSSERKIPVPSGYGDCKAVEIEGGRLALCRNQCPRNGQRVVAVVDCERIDVYLWHTALMVSTTNIGEIRRVRDADAQVLGVCVGVIELFED
jgi:transcriptional regulator with XRE-family HTH domain